MFCMRTVGAHRQSVWRVAKCGKKPWGDISTGRRLRIALGKRVLPFVTVGICDILIKGLADTGCEQSVIHEEICRQLRLELKGPRRVVEMLNGELTNCFGEVWAEVMVDGIAVGTRFLVASDLVYDAKVILGIDIIKKLDGISVDNDLNVKFGTSCARACAVTKLAPSVQPLKIHDSDFNAAFDGVKWTVEWKWEEQEPKIMNRCPMYPVPSECYEAFTREVDQWITDGWMQEYDPSVHGQQDGVIPLMAVKQPNKQRKVRPVMDYRELNTHIISHPGLDTAVCQEKLRSWRGRSDQAYLLDLRKAYLQIHVSEQLQRFQVVKYKGKRYVMTRMGFGLNVAPKIMKSLSDSLYWRDLTAIGLQFFGRFGKRVSAGTAAAGRAQVTDDDTTNSLSFPPYSIMTRSCCFWKFCPNMTSVHRLSMTPNVTDAYWRSFTIMLVVESPRIVHDKLAWAIDTCFLVGTTFSCNDRAAELLI